jgi:hypothetical protein
MRQLQKIFYQIMRLKRLITKKKTSNKEEPKKVVRNSHGFPTYFR